jgi:3-methyladenine DNA glycosylase AlkD
MKIDYTSTRLKRDLRGLVDAEFREGQQNYFKESASTLGVRAPEVRKLASTAVKEYRRAKLNFDDVLQVADRLWRCKFLEERILGIIIVSKYQRQLERRHWKHFDGWVNSLTNWAETDGLCSLILAEFIKKDPTLTKRLAAWTTSDNRWRRRSAAVALVPLARHGEHHDTAFQICERLATDRDDMVEKGIGWLLKEVSRTQPDRVASFLLSDIDRFSRTTVRYACEKLPEGLRTRVMHA